jgi:serine/threonine protein kinase
MSSAGQRIGKYEVQAQIAKGARSAVFRGVDGNTGKPVALKIIPRANLNAAAVPAYRKYGLALQRVDHPGIAAFLDLFEDEKAACVVSELCEGVPLSSLLKPDAHPDMKNAWEISRKLLETLAFAHLAGAVHRDLKPGNIMLAPGGRLKITDFGVAALIASAPEVVHYRAPEQFGDAALTARTDIYNAGAVIYHLITGKLPFTGRRPRSSIASTRNVRRTPPRTTTRSRGSSTGWCRRRSRRTRWSASTPRPISPRGCGWDCRTPSAARSSRSRRPPRRPRLPRRRLPPRGASAGGESRRPNPPQTPIREPIKPPVAAGPARPTAAGARCRPGPHHRRPAAAKPTPPPASRKRRRP